MFIDRKEAQRRVKDSEKILKSVNPSNGSHTSNNNGSHPPDTPESPKETEPYPEADLKSLLGVKPLRTRMTMDERASLGIAGTLLGGRRAGLLYSRGVCTSHELRHGFVTQTAMYGDAEHAPQNPDAELVNKLNEQKSRVRDLAFDRLTSSIGLITHEKLEKIADVTKLARVSRDLATVVDKTLPKDNFIQGGVHFHVWKPDMKEESHYEVINVNSPVE